MPEAVRLVVWDLDDTFWQGTLTEGGITRYVDDHHAIVVELAKRGIMSSICSKNDRATVRALLEKRGIWEYFVFPSIDWTPKSPRLLAIIEDVQLRAETILFIDDNPTNRGEASALVPGLQVADETIIAGLLSDPRFIGKDDSALSRLAQYKLLETKAAEKAGFETDVNGFLRNSAVQAEIDYAIEAHTDRIIELINRTNQLNFTKNRLPQDPEEARRHLLADLDATYSRRAGVVKVKDKFGDYGVVGFWMMDGVGQGRPALIHFVFSCRTLGMGIEQWTYEKLGRPSLKIVGEVVSALDFSPDWINLAPADAASRQTSGLSDSAVVLRGGCELEVLGHFFGFDAKTVTSEFVFQRGTQTVWRSHIVTLFADDALQHGEARAALRRVGYEPGDFGSSFDQSDGSPRLVVMSNSADMFIHLYRHKRLGFFVPAFRFGLHPLHVETSDGIEAFISSHRLSGQAAAEVREVVETIQRDYDLVDFDVAQLEVLYDRLLARLPETTALIFLLPLTYFPTPDQGRNALPKQADFNAVVTAVAARHSNVFTLDTADFLRSDEQMLHYSRFHFTRDVYFDIYQRASALYEQWRSGLAKADGEVGRAAAQ